MAILVQDTLNRANTAGNTAIANAAGWGTSSDGNTWSSAGSTQTWSIDNGDTGALAAGKMTGALSDTFALLSANTYKDAELLARFQSSVTASCSMGFTTRYTATNNQYTARLTTNGASGSILIKKNVSGTSTTLVTQTITLNGSTWYWLRFRVQGSNLYAKVWADGSGEPNAWTIVASDTALSAAGNVGFWYSLAATTNFAWVNSFTANTIPGGFALRQHHASGRLQ